MSKPKDMDSRAHKPAGLKPTVARRTASTESTYIRKVHQLQNSALARLRGQEEFNLYAIDPTECDDADLVVEFKLWAQGRPRASWDLYRAAILWHLRRRLDQSPSENIKSCYDEVNQLRFIEPESKSKDLPEYRDLKPACSIPKRDLDRIIDALLASNRRDKNLGIKTQCWLLAGLATGLRPNEWETAYLTQHGENKWFLTAPNSKRKASIPAEIEVKHFQAAYPGLAIQNRFDIESAGFPMTVISREQERTIPVKAEDVVWVQNHLAAVREHLETGTPFSIYFNACRQALTRACKSAFGGRKRYTLYVARHQFSANIKNIYTKDEVAALMGHDDVESAPKLYASRNLGYPEFRELRKTRMTVDNDMASTALAGEIHRREVNTAAADPERPLENG
jgi:hypothetical protein